jgi:GNAT superfamily N-acetyltransferase
MSEESRVRRVLRPGDLGTIVALHGRVYGREYGVDSTLEGHIAATVARAAARGFPGRREAICIVESDGEPAGSVALTDEGSDEAVLRWFLLDPRLRGRGLGRRLLGEMLAKAEEFGYARVALETFSELEAAAHLYRDHGFKLVSEDSGPRWGRDRITYQRHELDLRRGPTLRPKWRQLGACHSLARRRAWRPSTSPANTPNAVRSARDRLLGRQPGD